MTMGESTAAHIGAVKVRTMASFRGSIITAIRSARTTTRQLRVHGSL